jgi:hypothetical protein
LVEYSTIGTEEAEFLARGQTPVPDLRKRRVAVGGLAYVIDTDELPTLGQIKVT